MIADNDLDHFSDYDINEMEEIGSSDKVDFIVIRDRLDTSKGINVYWIFKDEDRVRIRSPIVKVYDELDMCDTKTINETISYVINNFPSEKYALILWSHGSGAVPKWYNPLWFGEDYSHKSRFDIDELIKGIKEFKFEFIAFDGCSMADVEIVDAFLEITKYLIFSQTEILAEGYPYDRVMKHLLEIDKDNIEFKLIEVAKEYISYCLEREEQHKRSGSISVVKVEAINNFTYTISNWISEIVRYVNIYDILSVMSNSQRVSYIYTFKRDLISFLTELNANSSNKVDISHIFKTYNEMVLYEAHTENYLGGISLSNLRGLNVFLPLTEDTNLINYYRGKRWYSNSGMFFIY